jgi:hypothetical protein
MKAISKLIRSGDKIPKEKIFQFRFEDDKVEDVKSMSLKKAVKFFQNKYSTHKIAKVYYINKRGEVPVPEKAPPPVGLDWDLFQGRTFPMRPSCRSR